MKVPSVPHFCQHLVLSVFWILVILIDVWWYLIILISVSMITYDMVHLFICLFAICISDLVRCLLRSLVHFFNRLFTFLLLSFKSSLYILDDSLLSYVSFTTIFSQSVACLLILLTLSFTEEKFLILMKSSLSIISFTIVPLVLAKKSSPYSRSSRFPLCYHLGVL